MDISKEMNAPMREAVENARGGMTCTAIVLTAIMAIAGLIYYSEQVWAGIVAVFRLIYQGIQFSAQLFPGESMLIPAGLSTGFLVVYFAAVSVRLKNVPAVANSSVFKAVLTAGLLATLVTSLEVFNALMQYRQHWGPVGGGLLLLLGGMGFLLNMSFITCLEDDIPQRIVRIVLVMLSAANIVMGTAVAFIASDVKEPTGVALAVLLISVVNQVQLFGMSAAQDRIYTQMRESRERIAKASTFLGKSVRVVQDLPEMKMAKESFATVVSYDDLTMNFVVKALDGPEQSVPYNDFRHSFVIKEDEPSEQA